MPPKSSKKPSKPSPSRKLSSPSDRSSPSSPLPEPQSPLDDERVCRELIQRASLKYPSFISSSSLIGRITAVDSKPSGHAATLWLSETAMVTSSLHPGSLVSVSLAASSHKEMISDFPLESLEEECSRHFGIDIGYNICSNAGSFFALAVVFPSCKVLKNGVRLSWSLACTMGGPDVGRTVFVSPIQNQSEAHPLDGIVKLCDSTSAEISHVPVYKCTNLYLKVVPLKNGEGMHGDIVSLVDFPTKDGLDHYVNGCVSSPKTPSPYQSKASSLAASQMCSSICEKSSRNLGHLLDEMPMDVSAVRNALEDEKQKELLEISAAWWLNARCLLRGNLVVIPIGPQICFFRVDDVDTIFPKGFKENSTYEAKCSLMPCETSTPNMANHFDAAFLVESKTKVLLFLSTSSPIETPVKGVLSFVEDEEPFDVPKLGGLSKEFEELKQIIFDKVQRHRNYTGLTGVLLHGPPGTGKTSLACSCAHDAGVKLFSINGPEIVSEDYGKSEQELRQVFDEAKQATSAMVFIDELDAIAPARQIGSESLSQRMVVTLLQLMDEVKTTGVLVVAATNRPDSIDPALRRHGRFDREIEIGVPSRDQRLDILLTLLSDIKHSLVDTEIVSLASTTHGFVGADLAALCNNAAESSLCRYIKLKRSYELQIHDQQEPDLIVTFDDFEKAKNEVTPSMMREVMVEVPKVSWEDIGGQDEVKKRLIEAVEWPQKNRNALERLGIRPATGVLMFGPPGCSKTLMARAVASNAGLNFLAVKGPELFSKWVGESEKAVRSLFDKARAAAPSIIFFDEIDGLATIRGQENDGVSVGDRVINQLLAELDGLNQRVGVTVIAATNRLDKIDSALIRPGRFDMRLYVGPPNEADREAIFRIHLRRMPRGSDVRVQTLAHLTEGCTGADISSICRKAALVALEENRDISEVSMRHFDVAIGRVQPSKVRSYEELLDKISTVHM